MKSLMLGACLAAVLGAPALAQPADQDQPDPYYDQPPAQASQPPPVHGGYQNGAGDDQSDRGYGQYAPPPPPPAGQPGYQVYQGYQGAQPYGGQDDRAYDHDRAYAYRPRWRADASLPPSVHYTRRTGAAWRNDQGQICVWRQLTWLDQSGAPAYRWVPRCGY